MLRRRSLKRASSSWLPDNDLLSGNEARVSSGGLSSAWSETEQHTWSCSLQNMCKWLSSNTLWSSNFIYHLESVTQTAVSWNTSKHCLSQHQMLVTGRGGSTQEWTHNTHLAQLNSKHIQLQFLSRNIVTRIVFVFDMCINAWDYLNSLIFLFLYVQHSLLTLIMDLGEKE